MAFMDDLKTDQRTQILVAGIVFFAIAFPVYFNFAASNVDEVQLSGPVGNYSVEGTYSYHQIASGSAIRKRWLNRRHHGKLRCFNG